MEFLVDMVTTVPDGTSEDSVSEIRTREAARSKELRVWRHDTVTPLTPHPNDPGR